MKLIFSLLCALCVLCGSMLVAADEPETLPAWEPRVIDVAGAAYPKARVTSVDAIAGTFLFQWLDAEEKPVDSGNSIGRFTPLDPVAYPDDATLSAAIVSPPAPPTQGVWTTLTFLERFTDSEKAAIFSSTDAEVIVARSLGLAAQDIRTEDPRTQALMTLLASKGLLTESRKTAILTP